MNKIYLALKLTKGALEKKLEKAKKKWREVALRPVDKILLGEIKLPKILHKGRIIDLQKKYKDAQVVCTQVGVLLGLPYLARKGDGLEDKYIHFNETPLILVVDPEDSTRLFLAWGKGIKVTDRGIIG